MVYTYSILVADRDTAGSIKEWVNATDIPSTTILAEAEAHIYQNLRVREMLTKATGTVAQDDTEILLSVFTNYRQPYLLKFTGETSGAREHEATRLELDELIREIHWDNDGNRLEGPPQNWATDNDSLIFDLKADQAYTYWFWFYQALAALSVSNETNFLTDKYPTMLRSACLMKAAEWKKNENERSYQANVLSGEILATSIDSDREKAGMDLRVVPE